jgi:hypothetical protein
LKFWYEDLKEILQNETFFDLVFNVRWVIMHLLVVILWKTGSINVEMFVVEITNLI